MLKHHEETHDLLRVPPTPVDELPELPEGVVVPDDLRSLPPVDVAPPRRAPIRWLRWIPAVLLVALGAAALGRWFESDATVEVEPESRVPTYLIVQSEIDRAKAEFDAARFVPTYLIVQNEIDRAVGAIPVATTRSATSIIEHEIDIARIEFDRLQAQSNAPAYLQIQRAIDRAVAAQALDRAHAAAVEQTRVPAYLIVQNEIDAAKAEFDLEQAESQLPAYLQIEHAIEEALEAL